MTTQLEKQINEAVQPFAKAVKELQSGSDLAPAEKTPRKSPVYKLSPDQLTQQVIALETKHLQAIQAAIAKELTRRADEHRAALKEIEGEK